MLQIERILHSNPILPVLYTNDKVNGDTFQLGTREKLTNKYKEHQSAGIKSEIFTAEELLKKIDFNQYSKEPTIKH